MWKKRDTHLLTCYPCTLSMELTVSEQWLNLLSVLPPSLIKVPTEIHVTAVHLHRGYIF